MKEELKQLVEIGAWHPVLRKDATKLDSKGNLVKVKARLCAGGHRQPTINPNPSSSPTAQKSTVNLVCSVAAFQQRHIATADVKGAFLHAKMIYDIFMQLDRNLTTLLTTLYPDYTQYVENQCLTVKLDRALYGCKESALLWYEEISSFLLSIGLRKSSEDDCLFLKGHGEQILHVVVFIDDFLCSFKLFKTSNPLKPLSLRDTKRLPSPMEMYMNTSVLNWTSAFPWR